MVVWLKFFFNPTVLASWFSTECSLYFDVNYVNATLVPMMQSRAPHAFAVLSELLQTYPLLAVTGPPPATATEQAVAGSAAAGSGTLQSPSSANSNAFSLSLSSNTAAAKRENDETLNADADAADAGALASTLSSSSLSTDPSSTSSASSAPLDLAASLANVAGAALTRPAPFTTVPQPFKLSEPRMNPRKAPLAVPREEVFTPFVARPVPTALLQSNSLEQIQQARKEAKERTLAAVVERHQQQDEPFQLASAARIEAAEVARQLKARKAQEEEELERAQQEKEKQRRAASVSSLATVTQSPVKMTVASVLREDALYRRQQQETVDSLVRFAQELKDSTEYEAWKKKCQEAEEHERQLVLEQRKLTLARASEDAQAAVRRRQEEAHEAAVQLRKEMQAFEVLRIQEMERDMAQKRQAKEEVNAFKANIPKKLEAIAQEKAAQGEQKRRERELNRRKVLQEREALLAAHKELIKQVQAMEQIANARSKRPKEVDRTTSSGLGLLDEMSLVELQARLRQLKDEQAHWEQEKRKVILEEKRTKQAKLAAIAKNHALIRERKVCEGAEAREGRRAQEEAKKAQAEERDTMLAVAVNRRQQEVAEAKREAALALAREVKLRQEQASFYNATKSLQEQQRLFELGAHEERVERLRASKNLSEQESLEAVRLRDARERKAALRREMQETKSKQKHYDADLAKRKVAAAEALAADLSRRKALVTSARDRDAKALAVASAASSSSIRETLAGASSASSSSSSSSAMMAQGLRGGGRGRARSRSPAASLDASETEEEDGEEYGDMGLGIADSENGDYYDYRSSYGSSGLFSYPSTTSSSSSSSSSSLATARARSSRLAQAGGQVLLGMGT